MCFRILHLMSSYDLSSIDQSTAQVYDKYIGERQGRSESKMKKRTSTSSEMFRTYMYGEKSTIIPERIYKMNQIDYEWMHFSVL